MYKLLFSVSIFILLFTTAANAQKSGYFNPYLVLSQMPESKTADSLVNSLTLKYKVSDSIDVAAFTVEYKRFEKMEESNKKSYLEMRERLNKRAATLQQNFTEHNKLVTSLSDSLYRPMFSRLNKAIYDFSLRENYDYVFDLSKSQLLFTNVKLNITNFILKELGLKEVELK